MLVFIDEWGHGTDRAEQAEAMPNNANPIPDSREKVYQIRIRGHLGPRWNDWFEGMTVEPEANGDTLLTGPVVDQAALYGVLRSVRDVGLPLLSVVRIDPTQEGAPDDA
jgi:hypothetical protein